MPEASLSTGEPSTVGRPGGPDRFDPGLFLAAQDAGGTFGRALAELRAARKTSHWMWFVFPQLSGLGRSQMAQRYSISSLAEAEAYLAHPVLGERLRACARALLDLDGPSATDVLGPVDALKLRSSMTLFWRAEQADAPEGDKGGSVFYEVLERFFDGSPDALTDDLLARQGQG